MPVIKTLQSPGNQPAVPVSSVKLGVDTLDLTSEDLQNKIINLRFRHKPKNVGAVPKMFTIRSDYEALFFGDGFQYVECVQKPMIKVEFNQVANDTVVSLTIDITNLFIKDPSTLELNDEPIEWVDIQMGYLSQMDDWARNPAFSTLPISDFYALKSSNVTTNAQNRIAATRMTAQVLSVEKLSSPPDMVTRFTCVVGTMTNGLRWLFDDASLKKTIDTQTATSWNGRKPTNALPDTFFSLVTRRFVKPSIRHDMHEVTTTKTDALGIIQFVKTQAITIYDNDGNMVEILQLEDGVMSVADANKYGVVVYLSNGLWETALEELPLWHLTEAEKNQAQPVSQPLVATDMQELAPGQLNAISNHYNFIRYYLLFSGDYFAYHVKEGSQEFFKEPFVYDMQQKGTFKIPAVYDITWGGTRQIRMPFFGFIGPMTTVAFQARYALNDMTGNFYHPAPKNNKFLVLLSSVSFDTAGKENMCTITATDVSGTYEPTDSPDGSIAPVPPPAIVASPVRNKIWKKSDWTVVYGYKGADNTVDSSWAGIANRLVQTAQNYVADRWGGTPPDKFQALDALQSWNPSLFASGRLSHGASTESGPLGRNLPILFGKEYNPISAGTADVVHVRIPFLPTDYYDTVDGKAEEIQS